MSMHVEGHEYWDEGRETVFIQKREHRCYYCGKPVDDKLFSTLWYQATFYKPGRTPDTQEIWIIPIHMTCYDAQVRSEGAEAGG